MSGRASSGQRPVESLRGIGIGTHSRSGSEQERPVLCSLVSKDRLYKPMVKTSGAQRESGGVVVPRGSGKRPDFGRVGSGGKRQGMTGTTRSDNPPGHESMDKVRKLQRRLYVAAKRSPERRFPALLDRIFRSDVLKEAWRRVRSNRGAAGVDRETLAEVEGAGVVRQRVKELTGRNRNGIKDVRVLISDLNPVLRGWGNYFRTGNAADKFRQLDRYVVTRLCRFLVRRHGRHLRAGQVKLWTEDWLNTQGLHRLRGTIRYPGAA